MLYETLRILSDSNNKLSITFSGGSLIAESSQSKLTLPAASLVAMRFSETPATSITQAGADNDCMLETYSVGGIKLGVFKTWTEMTDALPKGTYIIRYNGITLKTMLN